jgi:hypothetical protein
MYWWPRSFSLKRDEIKPRARILHLDIHVARRLELVITDACSRHWK